MTRLKITAPNPNYAGTVGELQFSKGVAEGDVTDSELAYFRASGYGIEESDGKSAAGDGDGPVAYEDQKVADLKAEIERRNEDRDEDAHLPKSGTKAELIAVLEADDAETSAAGDGDDQNGESSE